MIPFLPISTDDRLDRGRSMEVVQLNKTRKVIAATRDSFHRSTHCDSGLLDMERQRESIV